MFIGLLRFEFVLLNSFFKGGILKFDVLLLIEDLFGEFGLVFFIVMLSLVVEIIFGCLFGSLFFRIELLIVLSIFMIVLVVLWFCVR